MTYIKTDGLQDDSNRLNRNIQFGVREFAMGTILNGMALHGGLRVYGGTFFVFSDYVKAAVRLSALQGLPVTYVFTHDSIAVGEDGPTHEPVEHLAGLRAMPNLNVFRPADARETQAAWYLAVTSEKTPTALVLTRQNLTVEEGTDFDKVAKGAYVVYENAADFDTILIATGSEVNLAVSAAKELASQGAKVRVVSMPSTDVFKMQHTRKKFFQMQFAVVLQSKWVQLKTGTNMLVSMVPFSGLIPSEPLPQHQKYWQNMALLSKIL